jgi:chromate transporter
LLGSLLKFRDFSATSGQHQISHNNVSTPLVDSVLETNTHNQIKPSLKQSLKVLIIWLTIWLGPLIVLYVSLGPSNIFLKEGLFFSKMAIVTFGGAYAVLAYVAQQAVDNYGWLEPGEMLDGLGMAETTPGPLIMIVQFVGFLGAYRNPGVLDPMTAGILGALITTWVTFTPCFLWIFLGGPYIESLRENKTIASTLTAITAAVVGVILNLAVWFSIHVLFNEVDQQIFGGLNLYIPVWQTIEWATLAITACAMIATLKFKVGMIPTLLFSGVFGIVYFLYINSI